VRAGRFFLYGAHDAGRVPHGAIPIRIEAGLAFGTGHHETTALCLKAVSLSARQGRPRGVLDLGCGSGVLAIAAAKLWRLPVIATDIDPIAVEVAHENCRSNGVGPLVRVAVADGTRASPDPGTRALRADPRQYPGLATDEDRPCLSATLARGGTAVLSGLLRSQESQVLSYYRTQGLVFRQALREGPWSALVLERAGG